MAIILNHSSSILYISIKINTYDYYDYYHHHYYYHHYYHRRPFDYTTASVVASRVLYVQPVMLILVLVLVLKDFLRTYFNSLSWSFEVRSLSLSWFLWSSPCPCPCF